MNILTETNSGELLPQTTGWVSMMLGAFIVALVIGFMFVVVGIVTQKTTGRSQVMGMSLHAGKLVNIGVGAMILGSVGGLVLWGSNLYTPAKMAEPATMRPAYDTTNDCDTEVLSTRENVDLARQILGDEQFQKMEFTDPGHIGKDYDGRWDFSDNKWRDAKAGFGEDQVRGGVLGDVAIDYKPMNDGENCMKEKVDPCFKVKVTGMQTNDGKEDGFMKGNRAAKEVTPAGFNEDQCGEIKSL